MGHFQFNLEPVHCLSTGHPWMSLWLDTRQSTGVRVSNVIMYSVSY